MMEQIEILRGADRVRRRPAVLFGSDGIEGVKTAFDHLLNMFLQEYQRGYGDRIAVTLYADHAVELQGNGRGLFLGSGDAIWQELFCALFVAGTFGAPKRSAFEEPKAEGEELIEALDVGAVQCASEYMDVRSVRDGTEYKLRFEKGENVGGLSKTPCSEPDGLWIRFKPDGLVFTETALPAAHIEHKLQTAALALPKLQATFRCETADGFDTRQYACPELTDYLTGKPCYTASLTAEGQERYDKPRYTAQVKVALCFVKEGGFTKCVHNMQEYTHGGTHLEAIIEQIGRYVHWELGRNIRKRTLLKHLQLVLVTDSQYTVWANATRTSLCNTLLRDMAEDTINNEFLDYLKDHKEYFRKLFK